MIRATQIFAVAAFALTFAPAAFAQDVAAPTSSNPIQALDDCVSDRARALEISGEAADLVAQAAVAECNRQLTVAAQSAGAFRGGPTREELRISMRESALVAIVEMRAQRHTPKPPPPPPEKPVKVKKKIP